MAKVRDRLHSQVRFRLGIVEWAFIHIITSNAIVDFNGGSNEHGLENVTCEQTLRGSRSLTIRVNGPLCCGESTDSNINSSSVTHQIEVLH